MEKYIVVSNQNPIVFYSLDTLTCNQEYWTISKKQRQSIIWEGKKVFPSY